VRTSICLFFMTDIYLFRKERSTSWLDSFMLIVYKQELFRNIIPERQQSEVVSFATSFADLDAVSVCLLSVCLSVDLSFRFFVWAYADGSTESGLAAPVRERPSRQIGYAFGLVSLGLAAAVAIIVNHQSAVSLEEVIVRGLDAHAAPNHPIGGPWNAEVVEPAYGAGKLDAMGLNLDHWAWDVHPPRNGAFNPVEASAPMQSLAGRPLIIKEFDTKGKQLYRHGYSDAYDDRSNEVSIKDIIHDPQIVRTLLNKTSLI
jgi:hypothetical protein